ncbi:hypothetical protein BDN72DRAFT_779478 [Pluteus cervinus]|uniref:Uncharacterized protein n=1 Tax=Pluteus cervinus TaxID=181527 RepID=A0ACD3A519_9AGAR|nr:hypothetical protein BDN72DRAFT_779478 [Pluteus cervinus]
MPRIPPDLWTKRFDEPRNAARRVPEGASIIPPSRTTTVAEILISSHLHSETSSSLLIYSDLLPTHPFPSTSEDKLFLLRFLLRFTHQFITLNSQFDNAWLSGSQSLHIPGEPLYRIPLWSIRLLEDVRIFKSHYQRWQSAVEWIDATSEESVICEGLKDESRIALNHIPYQCAVSGFNKSINLSTTDLALFLSNEWINDDMIDAGVAYILKQLGPRSRKSVATCHFIPFLDAAHQRSTTFQPRRSSLLDNMVQTQTLDVLYIPMHVFGNHWTLLEMDLVSRTFSYADSLDGSALPPAQSLQLLEWWYNALLPAAAGGRAPFCIVPPSFEVASQKDMFSCGITVLSTLDYVLLQLPPWQHELRNSARMHWFLRLSADMMRLDDDVEDSDSDFKSFVGHQDRLGGKTTDQPDANDIEMMFDHDGSPSPAMDISLDLESSFEISGPSGSTSYPPISTPLPSPSKRAMELPPTPSPTETSPQIILGSGSSDTDTSINKTRPKLLKRRAPPGATHEHQKKLKRQALTDPNFKPNPKKLALFRAKIQKNDSRAEFSGSNKLLVRCSSCRAWVTMRALYDLLHWKNHRNTQKCQDNRKKGFKTPSLFSHGFGLQKRPSLPQSNPPSSIDQLRQRFSLLNFSPSPSAAVPQSHLSNDAIISSSYSCPGLSRYKDPRIDQYFYRSNATGGGAPSRSFLAQELFGNGKAIQYRDLSDQEKCMVNRREEILYKWQNSRAMQSVYATNCENIVTGPNGVDPVPCEMCSALYELHTFQVRLRQPTPTEENMKYVRKDYRNEELGQIYLKHKGVRQIVELDDGRSPWLKFAQGVASGLYRSQDTFLGMVKAMVHKTERLELGKSLKNMKYDPGFGHLCNILCSLCPRGYQTFKQSFGGPGIRSMRQTRARLPRFSPGISVTNIQHAQTVLKAYKYSGPIALSWDDTELEPALAAYQQSKDTVIVIGSIHGPKQLSSMDDVDAFFEEAKFEKADKLRIWLLTIPLAKVPPILIAAVARGAKTSAEDLFKLHNELMTLLHKAKIFPVSMSADGTDTERNLQELIANHADSFLPFSIPNEIPGCRIDFKIPTFRDHPCVLPQDSKHGKKTGRNQLVTGARIIVLGNTCIFFSMIYKMAANILSPLFKHDVDKVDKQDDHAAARLFSAQMLKFQMVNYTDPKFRGVSLYLFHIGELIDAWQSRNITHLERAKMVLRTRFFLMAWRSHIVSHPDHSTNTQFISRQSYNIFINLCDSLLALIIVYRTYYPTYPLLHWLHSTESCEHVFGVLRQLKADFNYSDMLFLEPKLRTFLLGDFGGLTAEACVDYTSAGYHHTYFKTKDLDLNALLQYPSDNDLAIASAIAFAEVKDLLACQGIDAVLMLATYKPPVHKEPKTLKRPRAPQTFAEILTLFKDVPCRSSKAEDAYETCELALVADSVNKTLEIEALPDSPESDLPELKKVIDRALVDASNNSGSAPFRLVSCSFVTPGSHTLDVDALVAQRERHQPQETGQAVRKLGRDWYQTPVEKSLRSVVQHRLESLISTEKATSTTRTAGAGRQIRHTGTSSATTKEPEGRQKNKEIAQQVLAAAFVHKRATAFQHLQHIHENVYCANILPYNPLQPGSFILALRPRPKSSKLPPQLILGEVITMYTQADYKGAKHESVDEITSPGLPSFIYIQLYSQFGPGIFTSLSCSSLSSGTFLQIPRTHLLFSFAGFNITRQDLTTADAHPFSMITLCSQSYDIHHRLAARAAEVALSVDILKAKKAQLVSTDNIVPLRNVDVNMDIDDSSDSDDSDDGSYTDHNDGAA